MIKLYELEEDVTIYVLLDSSKSMEAKFLYARQLAAALAYIALHSMDKVVIYGMAEELRSVTRPTLGRGKILGVLQELETAELFGSGTDFTETAPAVSVAEERDGHRHSDFLSRWIRRGLRFLQ